MIKGVKVENITSIFPPADISCLYAFAQEIPLIIDHKKAVLRIFSGWTALIDLSAISMCRHVVS